jgi:anti-sigma regulatory factor (Ser/Thr protein kinase)
VFRNLIDNARSFSPADGEVRVSLARARGRLIATIDDDGPGMPPDNLETIFERFYTSRPKGRAFGGNSGLGLSIARQIVEAHGGELKAENRTDTGGRGSARFTVDLPKACATVDSGGGVILLTDMFGGTPSNLAISVMEQTRAEVIAGLNLPMLIKLASVRQREDLQSCVAHAQEAGRKYISVASYVLAGEK